MTTPTFHQDIRQWRTAAGFKEHLKAHDSAIAKWAKGIVIHHSVSPTPSTWNGINTMQAMMENFIQRGWDSGPHLFIVQDARNADTNGIWQMTPLNMPGTHARQCNSSTWGIEVVGNYTQNRWTATTTQTVLLAVAALTRWRKLDIDETTLKGHRDCNSTECPGISIQMSVVRTAARELMENYAY
jgi:hypothetical protein